MDKLDEVLERCCHSEVHWSLACNQPENEKDRQLLLVVLQFSALLIEHSFTRHLYNSMEHLTTLLSSSDMTVVLAVIDVLYVFRSVNDLASFKHLSGAFNLATCIAAADSSSCLSGVLC